ncbi:hypothetical protein BKA65DRAFT_552704 [Rhexocercosporidium sp. MPI-PUGE-AT-0058]|nr:hypothetical protein BKA65DRAFT_552704 [Rhexocercosporidium sp. MPI-PUGE-AT-0058]
MEIPTNSSAMSMDTILNPSHTVLASIPSPSPFPKSSRTPLPDGKRKRTSQSEQVSLEVPAHEKMPTEQSKEPSLAFTYSERIPAIQPRNPSLAVSINEEMLAAQFQKSDSAKTSIDQAPALPLARVSKILPAQNLKSGPDTPENFGPQRTSAHGFVVSFTKDDMAKIAAKAKPTITVTAVSFTSDNVCNVSLATEIGTVIPHPPLSRRSSFADPLPLPNSILPINQMDGNSSESSLARSDTGRSVWDMTLKAAHISSSALARPNVGSRNPEKTFSAKHSSRLDVPPSTMYDGVRSLTGSMIEIDTSPQENMQIATKRRGPGTNGTSNASKRRKTSDQSTEDSEEMGQTSSNLASGVSRPTRSATAANSQTSPKRQNRASSRKIEHEKKKPEIAVTTTKSGRIANLKQVSKEGSEFKTRDKEYTGLERALKGLPPKND